MDGCGCVVARILGQLFPTRLAYGWIRAVLFDLVRQGVDNIQLIICLATVWPPNFHNVFYNINIQTRNNKSLLLFKKYPRMKSSLNWYDGHTISTGPMSASSININMRTFSARTWIFLKASHFNYEYCGRAPQENFNRRFEYPKLKVYLRTVHR